MTQVFVTINLLLLTLERPENCRFQQVLKIQLYETADYLTWSQFLYYIPSLCLLGSKSTRLDYILFPKTR